MNQIKVIVFDFDDTLVKSERIKQEAPIKIFSSIPGTQEIVAEYRASHRNTPRKELITGILEVLNRKGFVVAVDNPVEHFVNEFGRVVEEAQINLPTLPGAIESLKSLSTAYHLYLNSATPQKCIERVIVARDWQKFFAGVYGSPPGAKTGHLQEIIIRAGAKPQEVVVIGDGGSDLESANACGCRFIGIRGEYYDFGNPPFPLLDDLRNLKNTITSLEAE